LVFSLRENGGVGEEVPGIIILGSKRGKRRGMEKATKSGILKFVLFTNYIFWCLNREGRLRLQLA
jgi:hypothetical protein